MLVLLHEGLVPVPRSHQEVKNFEHLRPCIVRECIEFVVIPGLFCLWADKDKVPRGHWTMVDEETQRRIAGAGPEYRLDLAKAAAERIERVEAKRVRRPSRRAKKK